MLHIILRLWLLFNSLHVSIQTVLKSQKTLNIAEILPNWSRYSLDRRKNADSDFNVSDDNKIYLTKDNCINNYLIIDTIHIFSTTNSVEGPFPFLKGENHLKVTDDCLSATFIGGSYELIIDGLLNSEINFESLFEMFVSNFQIDCDNLPLLKVHNYKLAFTIEYLLTLKSDHIDCKITGYGKSDQSKILAHLKIRFTNIFLSPKLLPRDRRSADVIKFENNTYKVDIKENEEVGKEILTAKATGGSGEFVYKKSLDEKSDRLFTINEKTGEIQTRSMLNHEVGTTKFSLDISATDVKNKNLIAYATVVITVLDVNDNFPIFKKSKYTESIMEEEGLDQFILTVQATDSDSGANGQITYSFVKPPNTLCPFKIDPKFGVIKNIEKLDREQKAYYVLTVKAEDHGTDPGPKSDTVLVNITILDKNDNKPTFSKERYSVTCDEDTPVGTTVLTIEAEDKDAGNNGKIEFRELNVPQFEINKETGQIKLVKELDYDLGERRFEFKVNAFDQGSPVLQHNDVFVEIIVKDVNDNSPKFTRNSYRASIQEDAKVGTVVYSRIIARDQDSNENRQITYSFKEGTPKDLPFSLSPRNGAIKTVRVLDYEIQTEYSFFIVATDHGKPPKSTEKRIDIEVENINDNSPRFIEVEYEVSISEDTRRGQTITKVKAKDPDKMETDGFEYSIVEGNEDRCFSIDAYSGRISLGSCKLDYKKNKLYKLKLKVIDSYADADQKPGFAYLVIKIFDANDNAPKFDHSFYALYVKEDVAVGARVDAVTATDDDSGENARISYALTQNSKEFRINQTTGEIRTRVKLDREKHPSYTIRVRAEDHGKPTTKSSEVTVIVNVQDTNDNPPIFTQDVYTVEILESVQPGHMVFTVSATDEDELSNKNIKYSLKTDGDGSFAIAEDSGMITTQKKLDRERVAAYKLVVVATDQGKERQLSSEAAVNVQLKDVQDSPPKFTQDVYRFTVEENLKRPLGHIKAELADVAFRDMITYFITKNVRNSFSIDRRTGLIEISEELDYEEQNIYIIEVSARAPYGLEDKCTVNITVTDVNDHAPVLKDFYIFLNNKSDSYNPYFYVPATDIDVSDTLTYSIVSGNSLGFVNLTTSTGELVLQKSIMNTMSEVQIRFHVTDGSHDAEAMGHISVSEVSSLMVNNSMFLILRDIRKEAFLTADMLEKFKLALSTIFSCDTRRIFILSIEDFNPNDDDTRDLLEIVISVREETSNDFLPVWKLKNLFYLHSLHFENMLNVKVLSIDYWSDYFCSVESCKNFEVCAVKTTNTQTQSSTIRSTNVIFRGIRINQKLNCTCPHGYRNGPDKNKCSEKFSLCYQKPCGEHGRCISTDQGVTCDCDPGYSGEFCEVDTQKSWCPKTSPFALEHNPCNNNGECINRNGGQGFTCRCGANADSQFCMLSTRHFPKNSYIALKGLEQRWNVKITLSFSTHDSNALLLYNGRYSAINDFIAIRITDGQVAFSVSKGSSKGEKEEITTAYSHIPGGVNDGKWWNVTVKYSHKTIAIAAGNSCDIDSAHLLNPENKHHFCSASKTINSNMKSLDLSAPLLIGGYPFTNRSIKTQSTDFVGCIRNVMVDGREVDLMNTIYDSLTQPGCPKKSYCELTNPCKNEATCTDGLYTAVCQCKEGFIGRYCEKDVQNTSPVVSLSDGSKLSLLTSLTSTSPQLNQQPTSIVLKTKTMNSLVWEEDINGKSSYLELSYGYPCYTFDEKITLNLSSAYVADGKWHQVAVWWQADKLVLSVDNNQHTAERPIYAKATKQALKTVGGHTDQQFVGCFYGFQMGGSDISLRNEWNVNVKNSCFADDTCTADTCGTHGGCSAEFLQAQCSCDAGYQGPRCVDICATDNPCLNGGECRGKAEGGFTCNCPANYTGMYCEKKMTTKCDDGYYGDGSCGPCPCDPQENYDRVCQKRTDDFFLAGTCFCKDTYYLANGKCEECGCLLEGSVTQTCNKITGQCHCKEGVIGQKCDRCPGNWQELVSECNEINTSCPQTYTEGMWWRRIRPGRTRQEDCPHGSYGNATRYCDERRSWLDPDLFDCVSLGFYNIQKQLQHIVVTNTQLTSKSVSDLASQLQFASSSAPRLYGNDIQIGYDALNRLVSFEGDRDRSELVSSDDHRFVENILKSTSRLFTLNAKEFWTSIQKNSSGTAGLMQEMERFVMILTNNLAFVKRDPESPIKGGRYRRDVNRAGGRYRRDTSVPVMRQLMPYSQATQNIYMEIVPIYLEDGDLFTLPTELSYWWKDLPVWGFVDVNIHLSADMLFNNVQLTSENQTSVGVLIYKTLGSLLPQRYSQEDGLTYTVEVLSDVFTLTIPGISPDTQLLNSTFNATFKSSLKNFTGESGLKCAFWNYSLHVEGWSEGGGWSTKGCTLSIHPNTSDVICSCTHLTSFALVTIQQVIESERMFTPDSLTYLAIALSLALLFIVFLLFLCLGELKSNWNSIHKNLVFATLLAMLFFITTINRTYLGTSECRLLAIAIHYFYTCVFAWLLVESLHMYRMLLEPRDINYGQMMFYYFIGWGAPVMVVGVTAGLKPDGYGNSEFCWVSIRDSEIMWIFFSPILAIIAFNILFMIGVAITSCEQKTDNRKKKKVYAIRYRLLISFVFLLVLTGMLGAAVILVTYEHPLFLYIFPGSCLFVALYTLLFYTLFNRKVRREIHNAYVRRKTGDKSYGIKTRRKFKPNMYKITDERGALMNERYKQTLKAFNVPTSSTTDSDTTDHQRRRGKFMDTSTDLQTTQGESSDSSDEESRHRRRGQMDSDSDSSENSSATDIMMTPNGRSHQMTNAQRQMTNAQVEWKQATQKKLAKRTYASDGPMHSTPSESDASERRYTKAGFTPTKVGGAYLSVIQSESDPTEESSSRQQQRHPPSLQKQNSTSSEDEDTSRPISILKKKSKYDAPRKKIRVKDSTRRPLVNKDDVELNDSQV